MTEVIDAGTSTLQNLSYAYYPTNTVQTMTNAVASSQNIGPTTASYGYGTGSDVLSTISAGGVVVQALGYTADGRIASLNPGIQAPGGQYITSLGYNQDGRLAAVNSSGGALGTYTYDGFGQRLIKTVSTSYGEIYQYGQEGALLEETNASGAAQADYIYLNGRPVAVLNGSTLYYLHDDMLGTPQLATDSNQNVQWQASYDPFGQASVSGTVTQNLRFPGQYFDVESGWNHNGFRDYAPQLGRYLEPDPLGRLGSGNDLYVYVGDNPVNFIDPQGLCPSRNCVIAALEQVIKDGEDTNGPNGYGKLVYGKVISAAPPFNNLVGMTGTRSNPIVLDPDSLSGFPNIGVQAGRWITHAFGAYQFMPGTWKMFGGGSDISAGAQDDVAANMLEYFDAVQPAMDGNLQQAFWNMFPWASMPDAPYPQRHISMQRAIDIFNKALGSLPECQ
jgi:RHS repeat-associated protein